MDILHQESKIGISSFFINSLSLYPFMKNALAAEAIQARFNYQIASHDQQEIELENFKEDIAVVEKLGIDINKVFTVNAKEGGLWSNPITKAASLSNYADDVIKPLILKYILQRLYDTNYKIDNETVGLILDQLSPSEGDDGILRPLHQILADGDHTDGYHRICRTIFGAKAGDYLTDNSPGGYAANYATVEVLLHPPEEGVITTLGGNSGGAGE